MESFETSSAHYWNPFSYWGIDNPYLLINKELLINTWITMGVLIALVFIVRFFFYRKNSLVRFMLIAFLEAFMDLTQQTLGSFSYYPFSVVVCLFTFILMCNWISLIPYVEEPTKYLNTTLALAIVAFFYKEYITIKNVGIGGYLKEFLQPFFIMLPINIIGHFSKIVSMSFRLFGNIFGGAIITSIYMGALAGSIALETLGLISGLNIVITSFFVIFEGFIQAFVFAMLTLTYLAIAMQTSHEGMVD